MSARGLYNSAASLEYQPRSDRAPRVGVKGGPVAADEIVRLARRFGVPVIERPELARTLQGLETDAEIPEELFEAVAVVLRQIETPAGGRAARASRRCR